MQFDGNESGLHCCTKIYDMYLIQMKLTCEESYEIQHLKKNINFINNRIKT